MELFEKTKHMGMTCFHMSLFAAMSPIGIFIVIGTESSMNGEDSPVIILLSAVATGTILYIVFFEILQRERSEKAPRFFGILLYLCMLAGFALMFCLTLYISE